MTPKTIWAGLENTSLSPQGVIKGHVFRWGTPAERDTYNTWFDKARPPQYSYDGQVNTPIFYEHGTDKAVKKEAVGVIRHVEFDDIGLAFIGELDQASPYFRRIVDEITSGILKTSSGTMSYLAEFRDDGSFDKWYLGDVSLTKTAAERKLPTVAMLRSLAIAARDASEGEERTEELSEEPAVFPLEDTTMPPENQTPETTPVSPTPNGQPLAVTLTQEQLNSLLAGAVRSALSAVPQTPPPAPVNPVTPPAPAVTAEQLQAAIRSAFAAPPAQHQAIPPALPPAGSTQVLEPRVFARRSLEDLVAAHQFMQARGLKHSAAFLRVLAGRAAAAIEKRSAIMEDYDVRATMDGATRSEDIFNLMQNGSPAFRSDEVMTSTNSGNGDEWVGVAYSNELWKRVRDQGVMNLMIQKGMRVREVPQGAESVVLPLEGSDPTVYHIASQSADVDATGRSTVSITASPATTAQATLTPQVLAARVIMSYALVEDSFVNAAPEVSMQLSLALAEAVEKLMLNGDTETGTTNINYNGSAAVAGSYYLASDGLLKYGLVTGSSSSFDIGTLDDADFRTALRLMPSAVRPNRNNLLYILDADLYATALGVTAIKTHDVRGQNATVTSGDLGVMFGIDTAQSGFILKAASTGKIAYNAAGTLGRMILAYAPYWYMGWKRRVLLESEKDIQAQTNILVGSMRLGFKPFGAGAAVVGYNGTIA